MIVDDDPFFRSLFKVVLGQTGWPFAEIWEAEDSYTALRICGTKTVDLAFCDFHLTAFESKTGLQVVRELRLMQPNLPVFMVTAENSEALIGRVRAVGATGHLLKPINLRTLRRILASNLSGMEGLSGAEWPHVTEILQPGPQPLPARLPEMKVRKMSRPWDGYHRFPTEE